MALMRLFFCPPSRARICTIWIGQIPEDDPIIIFIHGDDHCLRPYHWPHAEAPMVLARHDAPSLPELKAAGVPLAIDSCPQVGNLCARSGGAGVGLPPSLPPFSK
jgi:hypothetical protein